jgi:hypothetical protein
MTRLHIYIDSILRLDEPTSRADLDALPRSINELKLTCLEQNRRLLIVAQDGNVHRILVQI